MLGSTPLPSRSDSPANVSSTSGQQQAPGEGEEAGDSTPLTNAVQDDDTGSAMDLSTTGPPNKSSVPSSSQEHESNEQAVTTSDQNASSMSTTAPPQLSSRTSDADNDVQMEEDVAGRDLQTNSVDGQDQTSSFISSPLNQTTTRSSQQQNLDVDPVFDFDQQAQIAAPPAELNLHINNLNNSILDNYLRDHNLFHYSLDTDLEEQLPTQPNSPTSDMEDGAGSEIGSNLTTDSTQETIDRLRAENEDLRAEIRYAHLMAAIAGTGCERASLPQKL